MKLVIVSGLSGAGKTVALKQYEDLGYTCIDNLPLALLKALVSEALSQQPPRYGALALGIDAREQPAEIARFTQYLEDLKEQGVDWRVVFLTANEKVLLARYSETRRRHPLSDAGRPLRAALAYEQELLEPIANTADAVIDTSELTLHELRERIQAEIPGSGAGTLSLTLLSFGFKHGTPTDADFLFDVRCLPNPHWRPELRRLTGRDEAVAEWLGRQPDVQALGADIEAFLRRWLPLFRQQDRAYLTLAIGCTGGQHRSVYLVEQLAARLRPTFHPLTIRHRELNLTYA